MFTLTFDNNIKAYLKNKYPNLKEEYVKATMRIFLLSRINILNIKPKDEASENEAAAGDKAGGNNI